MAEWPARDFTSETQTKHPTRARAGFPGATLADLYDPLAMPPALAAVHAALGRAVDKCYRDTPFASDRSRVEHLFRLYEQRAAPPAPTANARRQSRPRRPD
ncbi:MAG: type IIL restriction-modification enzyme MmeI [Limisphaerales bacterium]